MENRELYMQRAIDLSQKGKGMVAPNPMVGAVIVCNDTIIGEGYHPALGQQHAEVMALESVPEQDRHLIPNATMYVTLEPCSHFGRTPPCADRLIKDEIQHVVVGTLDPNPLVSGKGVARLRAAGVLVEVGCLEDKVIAANQEFLHFHREGLPFIRLKWAESSDGFIAGPGRTPVHITCHDSDIYVHQMRADNQAILIGAATAISDDPLLTVRHVKGRDPVRIIAGDERPLPKDLRMFNDGGPVITLKTSSLDYTDAIITRLKELQIISVVVEGGLYTLTQFIKAGLWNEIYMFTADMPLNGGIPAPRLSFVPAATHKIGSDRLDIYRK